MYFFLKTSWMKNDVGKDERVRARYVVAITKYPRVRGVDVFSSSLFNILDRTRKMWQEGGHLRVRVWALPRVQALYIPEGRSFPVLRARSEPDMWLIAGGRTAGSSSIRAAPNPTRRPLTLRSVDERQLQYYYSHRLLIGNLDKTNQIRLKALWGNLIFFYLLLR